jgi:hypothetical protein
MTVRRSRTKFDDGADIWQEISGTYVNGRRLPLQGRGWGFESLRAHQVGQAFLPVPSSTDILVCLLSESGDRQECLSYF